MGALRVPTRTTRKGSEVYSIRAVQVDIRLTPRTESAWFQLLESTSLSKTLVSNVNPAHTYTEAQRHELAGGRLDMRSTRRRRGAAARRVRRGGAMADGEFKLIPDTADEALGRYRKIMGTLYTAGGLLHVPDLFGSGIIASEVNGGAG